MDILLSNNNKTMPVCSSTLASLGEAQSVEIHILASLRFLSMRDRQAEIPVAHQKTYRWIFNQPRIKEDVPWSSFSDWLRDSDSIYWINGKAGSGKSTLMRYIFESAEMRKQLQVWAGKHHLETHGFFFWNGGSLEQRSQCGLLRSLLHQALYKRPNLVRNIFPDEVAENEALIAQRQKEKWNWTLPVLKQAFQRWVDLALNSSMNLCLFIDGLDEYEGDHESIVDFFKGLSSLHPARIKLCISSRPWVEFDEAFKGLPTLRLQDLTYRDIEVYVNDELRSHPRMVELAGAEPHHAHQLVTEIVTKASGVFLWVMLIVRSLLSGLRNRDDVAVLRQRLRHLPGDLSSLYTHMLDHVDPFYNEQASQTFQIYGALSNESTSYEVTVLELSLAITSTPHTHKSATTSMTDGEMKLLCENLEVHLKTRCAGLLEIHQVYCKGCKKDTLLCSRHINRKYPVTPTHKVNYLHRTVKDFLATDDVQKKMMRDCTSEFSPHTCIIQACVIRLCRSIFITHTGSLQSASNEAVWAMVVRAMIFAKHADSSDDMSYISALIALQQAGKHAWNFQHDPWKGKNSTPTFFHNTTFPWSTCNNMAIWSRNFIGEAIIHNVFDYIDAEVRENENLLRDQGAMPFLSYIFQQRRSSTFEPPSPKMVSLLFQRGADPSHHWQGEDMLQRLSGTIWGYVKNNEIDHPWHGTTPKEREILSKLGLSLKLFLDYDRYTVGTSSNGRDIRENHACYNTKNEGSISKLISEIYGKVVPSMEQELSHALQSWISRGRHLNSRSRMKRNRERDDSYGPRKHYHKSDQWRKHG